MLAIRLQFSHTLIVDRPRLAGTQLVIQPCNAPRDEAAVATDQP
jgi:hypothetical protein